MSLSITCKWDQISKANEQKSDFNAYIQGSEWRKKKYISLSGLNLWVEMSFMQYGVES